MKGRWRLILLERLKENDPLERFETFRLILALVGAILEPATKKISTTIVSPRVQKQNQCYILSDVSQSFITFEFDTLCPRAAVFSVFTQQNYIFDLGVFVSRWRGDGPDRSCVQCHQIWGLPVCTCAVRHSLTRAAALPEHAHARPHELREPR